MPAQLLRPCALLRRPLAAAALACLAALGGCLETAEERAVRAYDSHDFEAARALAAELAAEGNPRGHELLALMAAQGLGGPVDYGAALAAVDRAAAIDAGYGSARAAVRERIAADRAAAESAFADERYEIAFRLAGPLAAFGDEAGAALKTRLITGHYVALPGSAMPWRAFWETCAGNVRFEDEDAGRKAFDENCRGRAAVWDGTVMRRQGNIVRVKMRPGRPGARADLDLELDGEPDPALVRPGVKARFAGVVAERGTPARPDRLASARLVGPAPLTRAEAESAETRTRQTVAGACQKLAAEAYRAAHMPEWALETERIVVARGSPSSRAFSLQVGITSPIDRFERAPGGGWRGAFDGTVSIQSTVARASQIVGFTAECELGPGYRKGDPPAAHGALRFVAMSIPLTDSAPARMTPRGARRAAARARETTEEIDE